MVSTHYKNHRNKRNRIIKNVIKDDGYIIDGFVIDNGHKNGLEVHSITDKGIIIIHNYNTGKLITKLIARPKQINKYYRDAGRDAPKWLLDLCKCHKDAGYNK